MKKKRKAPRPKSAAVKHCAGPQGFEIGFVPRHMLVSESDERLNAAFRAANVVACAYGYDGAPGYPGPMPCISLVAEHGEHLKSAFDILAQWGSQEDGDCVDIQVLLRKNGSYLFSVGASPDRIVDRWNVGSLIDPLFFSMSWIKPFDTTNPILHEWAEQIVPPLTPVKIRGATADFTNGKISDISSIKDIENNKDFTKLHLKIEREVDRPDHWLISIKEKLRKGKSAPPTKRPKDIARARARVIDCAFPITRERIRHSGLIDSVQEIWGNFPPSKYQVIQAVINLCVSEELGLEPHFSGAVDLKQLWWNHVEVRVEFCVKPHSLPELEPALVAAQVELDVRHTLSEHGVNVRSLSRSALQKHFVRLGYAGE